MLTKYLLTPQGDDETLNSLLMYKLENANFNYEINVTPREKGYLPYHITGIQFQSNFSRPIWGRSRGHE